MSRFQSSTAGQHHLVAPLIIVRRISASMLLTSSSRLLASSSRRAASARPPTFPCPSCHSWMRASRRVRSGLRSRARWPRLAHHLTEQCVGGIAALLVLLRRQIGRVAESPPPPLRGDDRRLPVVVGWRRCRLWLRRAFSHDRRPLQRHRLPLPRRALVAVGRGDDAAGMVVVPRAGRPVNALRPVLRVRWPRRARLAAAGRMIVRPERRKKRRRGLRMMIGRSTDDRGFAELRSARPTSHSLRQGRNRLPAHDPLGATPPSAATPWRGCGIHQHPNSRAWHWPPKTES